MTDVASILPPKLDVLDPEVLADPYPTYAALRASGPLCRVGPASFGVTRYEAVSALLSDSRLVAQLPDAESRTPMFGDGAAGSFSRRIMSSREPPGHTHLRRLIGSAFSPKLVRRLRGRIGAMVDDLLAPILGRGRFDAVTDLAFPLQSLVICELIGIPAADRHLIWPEAMQLGRAFIPFSVPSEDVAAAADATVSRLRDYVRDLLARRRREPRDDLVSGVLAAIREERFELSPEEIVDNLVFICFAGFEPTMNLISTGLSALLDFPGEQARLRADRSLLPTAVEEFLRYDAPAQYTMRFTREPVRVGERTVKAGRVMLLLLGCANRDDARFTDPDRVDVGRHPNPHLSFGGGIHHCMGWALGRVENETVFDRVLERCAALERAGEPKRLPHPNFRAHTSLPISVRPA